MHTRYEMRGYSRGVFDSSRKKAVSAEVNERVRAHLRAAMKTNGLTLTAAADLLNEDKGALSNCLSGKPDARAPSVYLVHQMLQRFELNEREFFFGDKPAEEFYRPGVPTVEPRKYQIRQETPTAPPSDASRADAHPGKRRGQGGGSAA